LTCEVVTATTGLGDAVVAADDDVGFERVAGAESTVGEVFGAYDRAVLVLE